MSFVHYNHIVFYFHKFISLNFEINHCLNFLVYYLKYYNLNILYFYLNLFYFVLFVYHN